MRTGQYTSPTRLIAKVLFRLNALPSSYLVTRPWKAFDGYRFRELRDRPLCHLMVRQQTCQGLERSVADGLRMWESQSDFQPCRSTGVPVAQRVIDALRVIRVQL